MEGFVSRTALAILMDSFTPLVALVGFLDDDAQWALKIETDGNMLFIINNDERCASIPQAIWALVILTLPMQD